MYNTQLRILPILDLVDNKEKSITIIIKKSSHKFSRNASASGNGSVNIFGSESYNTIDEQNYNFINMEYTLPIIRIKRNRQYNMNIVNNTEYYFNFHWHGLTVPPENDGALTVLAFGPCTPSNKFNITGTLVNNSAITLNHPHNMNMSSSFLYGGLFNFINIEDEISAPVDNLFNYNGPNSNFLQLVYQDIDLNPIDGTLNDDKLYSFSWRAKYGAINGTSCINWYDKDTRFVDKLYYESYKNVVKVTLLNASCSYRNIYLGVCDINFNIKPFYLVQTDQGYRNPTLVNICSFSIVNRNSIMFDLNDFKNNQAYLFLYNYDLTNCPIENNGIKPFLKIYNKIPQIMPYNIYNPVNRQLKRYLNGKCPDINHIGTSQCFYSGNLPQNFKMNLQNIIIQIRKIVFGDNPSIINYANQHPNFELYPNINYLQFLNKKYFRNLPDLTNTPPTRKIIGEYDITTSKDNGSTEYISSGQNRFMVDIFNSNEKEMYNLDNTSILPTCLFKIIDNPNNYENYEMVVNNKLTVNLYDNNNSILQIINITFHTNAEQLPYNITEWFNIVNTTFANVIINIQNKSYNYLSDILNYDYEITEYSVPYVNTSIPPEIIHTIKIINTNKTTDLIIELVGPSTLLSFFGKPFMGMYMPSHMTMHTDNECCSNNSSLKQIIIMSGDSSGNTQKSEAGGNFTLKIEPNSSYYGFPDGYMNENYSNFTVLKESTELLYYCNLDTQITHPLHFHLTSFYFDTQKLNNSHNVPYSNAPTSGSTIVYNDYNQNLYSKDVVIVPPQKKLNFYLKYVFYSSDDSFLGYMYHCHIMEHHDMAMMGQFYVLNESNFNKKFITSTK
jgi:FtsP/CotA-like multicopper oxidase with cupredoxin domain